MSDPLAKPRLQRSENYAYDGDQVHVDLDYGGGRHIQIDLPAPAFVERSEWGEYISQRISDHVPSNFIEFDAV